MLQIAICDDNPQHRFKICQIAERALFSRTDLEVCYYENGDQVIEAIEQQKFLFDLLLLDIHMNQTDGMRTAEYIRRNSIDVDIIFITVSREHVYEGYTYKAFAYLLKPIDEKRMAYELKRYLDEKEQTEEYLNISVRGVLQRVPLRKILYFESDSRKVLIHLKNELLEFYGKMDEVEKVVGEKLFIRCHQSYLVNKKSISTVSRNELIVDDTPIPISRKYQKSVKDSIG